MKGVTHNTLLLGNVKGVLKGRDLLLLLLLSFQIELCLCHNLLTLQVVNCREVMVGPCRGHLSTTHNSPRGRVERVVAQVVPLYVALE